MKYTIRITTFIKATMKFAFGLFVTIFSVVINFLFSDTDKKQEVHDSLSNDQSHDHSLDWGDTHDDGWIG